MIREGCCPLATAGLVGCGAVTPVGLGQTGAAGLHIELRESDDEDADRDRLERLLAVLAEFPGDEEVRLTVQTLDGQSQVIKLAKVRVSIDGELLSQLSDVLGDAGAVSA